VFVSFNDPVKAGQPIAQLDQEIFAAHVNEAKAALSVAGSQRPGLPNYRKCCVAWKQAKSYSETA